MKVGPPTGFCGFFRGTVVFVLFAFIVSAEAAIPRTAEVWKAEKLR